MTDSSEKVTAGPERTDPAQAAYSTFLSTAERLRSEMQVRLLHTVQEGLERHRAVREEIGLDDDPPEEREERVERALEYRRVVTSELLDPIALHFENRAPASEIIDATTAAMHATVEAVRGLPVREELPWGEGAMAKRDADGRGRGLSKGVARLVGTGRDPAALREVPVRAVTQRHLRDELLPTVDASALAAALAWAEWSQDLERVWATRMAGTSPRRAALLQQGGLDRLGRGYADAARPIAQRGG